MPFAPASGELPGNTRLPLWVNSVHFAAITANTQLATAELRTRIKWHQKLHQECSSNPQPFILKQTIELKRRLIFQHVKVTSNVRQRI